MDTFIQGATAGGNVRKAVYLDLADKHQYNINRFPFSDWSVDRVTSEYRAKNLISNQHYLVGMVYLSYLTDEQRENIINLIGYEYGTVWIALVEEGDLEDSRLRTLIYENFYDYFTLPLDSSLVNLKAVMGHAYGISLLRVASEREEDFIKTSEMVGASEPMRRIFEMIRKICVVDASVLISGETGTGKEMVARAIHQRSSRCEGPFVAINCGALPDTLIHSELFGHEKGAFTGAHARTIGRLESAHNGTCFLDEIGDLPMPLQVYLLRFLEEQTIERLGGSETFKVDTRIIAATNVDLKKAVEDGRFRKDLFYRLNVVNIHIPTLAERFEDIELLAKYFYRHFAKEYNAHCKGFSKQALYTMSNYSWPGNIREMINRIRRALIMSDNRLITSDDLGMSNQNVDHEIVSLDTARDKAEALAVRSTLHYVKGNISKAAKSLGISRVTLYRLIKKYRLEV
ncbi:sigma-54 dependent transcriptional regulator [Aliamphritea ceti]|uniref:sigma-54 dependent transcriptional regulator n=1 Tax=Aliamphritea ceti TaxID=1524258 RepID=UPI0021C285F3|nr:sigma-54 dependent transcriptional regulator [Aliamphritea ceti]